MSEREKYLAKVLALLVLLGIVLGIVTTPAVGIVAGGGTLVLMGIIWAVRQAH